VGVFSAMKVKGVHLDEDPARVTPNGEGIFDELMSRISEGGFLVGSATPVLGKNWLFKRIYKKNIDDRDDGLPDPGIEWWQVSRADNRYHSKEMVEKARDRMSSSVRDRRFYGRFTTLSGMVFREYREDVNLLSEAPEISAGWRRVLVIDMGATVFACMWGAIDDMGRVIIFDEYYHKDGARIQTHAAEIKRITESHYTMMTHLERFRPVEVNISDWDKQVRIELAAHGVPTTPADKQVELGIELVNSYLMSNEILQPRLLISPKCRNTVREIEGYIYKPIRPGSVDPEKPLKIDDHLCDCLRYLIMYVHSGARNYRVQQ